MQQQANGDEPCFAGYKRHYINAYCDVAMQGMITDTATAGCKYGACQQVVKVNQHGEQQDDIGPLPLLPVKQQGNAYGK